MRKVQVYTITNCPYCERAKALLRDRKIPFDEVHVDRNDDEQVQELLARSKMKTFPQIFAGDKLIGGFMELEALDRGAKLMPLLNS